MGSHWSKQLKAGYIISSSCLKIEGSDTLFWLSQYRGAKKKQKCSEYSQNWEQIDRFIQQQTFFPVFFLLCFFFFSFAKAVSYVKTAVPMDNLQDNETTNVWEKNCSKRFQKIFQHDFIGLLAWPL